VTETDDPNAPVVVAGEVATALAFLDYLRRGVLRKLDGLSLDQARHSPVRSGTSLLGLVKHLTAVELYWFGRRFAGLEISLSPDSFALVPEDDVATVRGAYEEAARRSDEIAAAAAGPDEPMRRGSHGLTLRWVLNHVLEETARHAGHADILRELLDGTTGR